MEQDLMAVVPRTQWVDFSHRLIHHGRRTCLARKPRCSECGLEKICPKMGVRQASGEPHELKACRRVEAAGVDRASAVSRRSEPDAHRTGGPRGSHRRRLEYRVRRSSAAAAQRDPG